MRIERRAAFSTREFVGHYLARNRPVIVTDATCAWRLDTLKNADSLYAHFGGATVQVYDDLFALQTVCRLRDYLDKYWWPTSSPTGPIPYVRWYAKFKPVEFCWSDAAFEELKQAWSMPYFLPAGGYALPHCPEPGVICPAHDGFPAKGIFISAPGARTRLHEDPWCSDAVLCQLMGRKRVRLFSPEQARDLALNCQDARMDVWRLPGGYEDSLEIGEVLFIPAGWLHQLDTVSGSVSLTWNFVHEAHADAFRTYLANGVSHADREVLRFFACAPT
jgi:hypothetical protein